MISAVELGKVASGLKGLASYAGPPPVQVAASGELRMEPPLARRILALSGSRSVRPQFATAHRSNTSTWSYRRDGATPARPSIDVAQNQTAVKRPQSKAGRPRLLVV
jgi:hypothetical protein